MEGEPFGEDRRAIADIACCDMNLEAGIPRRARHRQPMRDEVSVISNKEKKTGHDHSLRVREDRNLDPCVFTGSNLTDL